MTWCEAFCTLIEIQTNCITKVPTCGIKQKHFWDNVLINLEIDMVKSGWFMLFGRIKFISGELLYEYFSLL